MDYFRSVPDPLGIRSIIQSNFNSSLTGELERLFVNEQAQRRRLGSGGSESSNSSTVWEEFSRNGREGELDDLDRLFRGMDLNLSAGLTAGRSVPPPYSVNVMIPPPSLGSLSGASTSSGSPTSSQEDDFSDLITSARMFEILKERERQKRKKANKPKATGKVCVFCRNNGEAEAVYTSHQLKDAMGRITCPVLFIYTCPICSARGENAHTIKYCPYNPGTLDQGKCLKTPRMAVGRRRLTPHLTPLSPQ